MIVRVPNASILTPVDIQQQVLEYGTPTTYGQLVNVSPLKRNSTINGGYDVMMDKIVRLTNNVINPNKSSAYIHFKKKWNKGMTLRFSGVAGTLTLEQNRIYLFAMDALTALAVELPTCRFVSIFANPYWLIYNNYHLCSLLYSLIPE